MKQKGTTWVDAHKKEIPTYAINPVLKVEEKEAQKLKRLALRAEIALEAFVKAATAAYDTVLDAKVKDANLKDNKTPTGSLTINSFDHEIEVKLTKPESVYFDNTYTEMVKVKFDEYFTSLNAGNETAEFLKTIVTELLFTSGGKLDMGKVLQLRKYRDRIQGSKQMRVKGKPFVEAVDLFDKAIKKKPGNHGIYISVDGERIALKYTDI